MVTAGCRAALLAIATAAVLVAGVLPATAQPPVIGVPDAPRVLVFSATYGYRHVAIAEGNAAIWMMGHGSGQYSVDISENPADLTAANLANYDAVVFHSTAGKTPLSDQQREDFIRFAGCGGGFVGIAMAADSNYAWPEFTELVGANVVGHPLTENHFPATRTVVTNPDHPINARAFEGVEDFETTEELYLWRADPRRLGAHVTPLLSLDTSTIAPSIQDNPDTAFPEDAPAAWTSTFRGKGRSYYNGFGHGDQSWDHAWFRTMIHEGIRWVLGPDGHPVDRACAAGEGELAPAAGPPRPDPEAPVDPCPMPTTGTYVSTVRPLTEDGATDVMEVGVPAYIFAPNTRYVLDLSASGARTAEVDLRLEWDGVQDYDLGITLPWGFAGSSRSHAFHGVHDEHVVLTDVPHCTDFLAAAENFNGAGMFQEGLRPTLTISVTPDQHGSAEERS